MPKVATVPHGLKAFAFLGLDLQGGEGGQGQAKADCPFCGKEGKFSVNAHTGLWDCKACQASGNPLTFLRQLWDASDAATTDYGELAAKRGLLFPETLMHWGACRSVVTHEWLLPGHDAKGALHNLYRWCPVKKSDGSWGHRLLPCPGVWPEGKAHGLFGVGLVNPELANLWFCEGPWDAMALWELVKDGGANVVAVPGAGTFQDGWAALAAGRDVAFAYDSDHARTHPRTGARIDPPGWAGMRRAVGVLARAKDQPNGVSVVRWGPEGFDPALPDGFDVRDLVTGKGPTLDDRLPAVAELLGRLAPVPDDWSKPPAKAGDGGPPRLEPLPCRDYRTLLNAWQKALHWTPGLEHALPVLLAVAASTEQVGDQLFLQLIGDAGSAKTKLCEALLVSRGCIVVEHATGFHSGMNDGSGEDFSFFARSNHKTWVTPEGDTMMSNPKFPEIMAQMRRAFDGSTSSIYKNKRETQEHHGRRHPWIIAGTPALLNTDQSRLGDRFIRCVIPRPAAAEQDEILDTVGFAALRAARVRSNCDPKSILDPDVARAYALTGGYVDHLRANVEELLGRVLVDEREVVTACKTLAKFVADFRARPDPDKRKEERHDSKELPTRLTHQFARLALCLAAVLNHPSVDADVLARVRRVALDTGRGVTMEVGRCLRKHQRDGAVLQAVAASIGAGEERASTLLLFMRRVGIAAVSTNVIGGRNGTVQRWRLTARAQELWDAVVGPPAS